MPGNGRRWWRSAARRANERQETTRARPLVGILGYTDASSALQLSFELIELLYRCRLGLMCRSNALFRLRSGRTKLANTRSALFALARHGHPHSSAVAPPAPLPGHGDEPDAQTAGHGLTRVLSSRSPSGRRDQMTAFIGRREFITLLGGGAVAWPLTARAQQPAMPVIGFLDPTSPDMYADRLRAFRQGLKDTGYVERENVAIEHSWAENQIDRLPELANELVRRQVPVITTGGGPTAPLAAKAATTTIPIVFAVGEDPVRLGLVASLNRPGGNLTGINFFNTELAAKRLELLREVVPGAARVAVLVNPTIAANTESVVRDVGAAARAIGLQIQVLNARTSV